MMSADNMLLIDAPAVKTSMKRNKNKIVYNEAVKYFLFLKGRHNTDIGGQDVSHREYLIDYATNKQTKII